MYFALYNYFYFSVTHRLKWKLVVRSNYAVHTLFVRVICKASFWIFGRKGYCYVGEKRTQVRGWQEKRAS